MSEQVRQDLEQAVAILDEHGWCRNTSALPDGRVCALGAVWAAVMGHDWIMSQFDPMSFRIYAAPGPEVNARFQAMVSALDDHLPDPYRSNLPNFNDEFCEDVEQVKDLFAKAIKAQVK